MDKLLQQIAADLQAVKAALTQTKPVLNPQEAAQYLGISLSTLYKNTAAGILPFSKPNNKKIYFSNIALELIVYSVVRR